MTGRRGRTLVLLGTLLALAGAVRADEPSPTRVDADRLVDRVVDGQPITYLLGDVFIERDSMTVRSDSALFYRDDDEYDFFGSVRMTRGGAVVTCRAAFYNDRTGDADFRGDVRMVDGEMIATGRRAELREDGDLLRLIRDARVVSPDYVVHADTVVNRDSSDQGEAFGNVIMVDPGGDSVVQGGHAVFDRDGGRVTVDRFPRLESRDGEREPLIADALFMDFLRDEDLVVMVDSVRIRQGMTRALADTARVYGRERMRLTGRPVMDDGEGAVFRGTSIETWYENGEPVRVRLEGEASVEDDEPGDLAERYPGLPPMDVLAGDTITVHMREGRPHRSLVVGHASSVYVPVDAAKEVAFNDVQGDTILIDFADKGVHQVDVRGNMTGTYSFMRLEELGERAAAAAVVMDSVLASRGDTLAALLPDSLAAALPTRVADWSELDPLRGAMLARALVDSLAAHGDSALVLTAQRALAAALQDTLADGRGTVDFSANRELVEYEGGLGLFQLADKRIVLREDARLIYGSIDLKAQDIRLETGNRELYATGTPLLVDSGEKIAGRDMAYDFGNRTGAVKDGVTTMDGYFYVGRHIKRFGDGELKIRGGKMTSCDLENPHYHFWADKMKIKMDDKVVAKPIVLKVGEVPLFALPFFFKSLQSGRRSGILFPTFDFGWGSRTGRYIRDWGYYWATNDYTDFTVRGDWNERRELTWQIGNRYIKRYAFRGDVRYSRRTTLGEQSGTRQWQFFWNHSQPTLFDVYDFKADVRMSSSVIERADLLNDVGNREVINGEQTSSVKIGRRWSFGSGNVSFKRQEYVNAADEDSSTNARLSSQTFPSLAVSFTSRPLASPTRGTSGGFLRELLSNTYFQHSYSASRQVETFETTRRSLDRANGSMSLSVNPPPVSIFSVSTGLNAGLSWRRDETTGEIYELDEDAEDGRRTVTIADEVEESSKSLAVRSSVSTTLYGIFRPRVGSLRAIRHTLRLSASHSWRPELGGVQSADQSVGLSLGNRFDLKFREAETDSGETYRKLDGVVDWTLNTSYDPDVPVEDRWSNINSTLSLQPGSSRNLKVSVNSVYDPYAMRMQSTRITYGLNFSGRFDTGGRSREDTRERNAAMEALAAADSLDLAPVVEEPETWEELDQDPADDFAGYGLFEEDRRDEGNDQTEGGRFIPWRLGSSFSYSKTHGSDVLSARAGLNASITLTRAWAISWRGTYDFESGRLNSQTWNLERDLHCWNLRFSRSVSSVDSQFGFIISLQAIPDLKVTRGRSDMVAGGLSGATNRLY